MCLVRNKVNIQIYASHGGTAQQFKLAAGTGDQCVQNKSGREMAIAQKRIFDEWLPSSNYRHAQTMEIECFPYPGRRDDPNYKFEVWIPII